MFNRAEKAFHKEAPLLANIMLDSLDKDLEKRGHKFALYADDFFSLALNLYLNSSRKFVA